MRKLDFCLCKNCTTDQHHCFSYTDSTSLLDNTSLFLNMKLQALNHLLWLQKQVCVRPGQNPQRKFFLHLGSNNTRKNFTACVLYLLFFLLKCCFLIHVFAKHYENLPMQYTEIFKVVKNENFQ